MGFVAAGLRELPKWLNGPQARAYITALRAAQDGELANLIFSIKQRFPSTCADDALDTAGTTFSIERFEGEPFAVYRARLLVAWDTWEKAGTRPGIIDALRAYGIQDVEVYESEGD